MRRLKYVSMGLAGLIALAALAVGMIGGRLVFGGEAAGEAREAETAGLRIDVIVKATDSDFWQSMLAGAEQAGADLGADVHLTGPTSEADIEEQVSLLEDSITRGVDAIVLAPNSSTALDGTIDRAREAGIPVIIADNAVETDHDGFIGTDNIRAGEQAGERMCELLTEQGDEDGQVLHESGASGQQVLIDRFEGFEAGLTTACPDAEVVQTLVNENDINTAVTDVAGALNANRDIAGVFADNNTSGTGAAQAVAESGRADELAVVAFDSDPAEVDAVRSGDIDAIMVQNPVFFGYQGVVEAAMVVQGRQPPGRLDPGAVIVDSGNVDDPELQSLLDPPLASE
ncbi:ABC transporter substrate-binding protein [Allonocardiopsis opalescens]|uniref:Monosaccharide ABC transporter substrate-binding protein (CUT2 family) n=1 Tax=Allonocardiopsis opalescens TaxID=1144618 RepID=A0A2T0Q0F8_9ACTN|nr:ABC transporter substrate-binding protein [Allonocardiopsis opalescens]PRX97270.1 monosaccharide ABC transporter substrate-binding protein (CUT2 family) [Allonocardiopsis opalescens]